MNKRKPVYIISDDPARKNKVVFGFEAYARTLAELIAFRDNRTPLVIGIYGPWGSGKTTRVTRYPNGISPAGCYDMAGNVWEWTSNWYDDEKTMRMLRGGSWYYDRDFARCASRFRLHPYVRSSDIGFRCARTKL